MLKRPFDVGYSPYVKWNIKLYKQYKPNIPLFFFLQYFYILGKRVKVTLKKSLLKFKPAKREEEDI